MTDINKPSELESTTVAKTIIIDRLTDGDPRAVLLALSFWIAVLMEKCKKHNINFPEFYQNYIKQQQEIDRNIYELEWINSAGSSLETLAEYLKEQSADEMVKAIRAAWGDGYNQGCMIGLTGKMISSLSSELDKIIKERKDGN